MSKEKQIEEMMNFLYNPHLIPIYGDCEDVVNALYDAGYRKQSEGEWLLIKVPTGVEAFGIREVQAYPKCSICGYMGDVSEWHFKYCPNCGAHMRGGKNE